MNQNFNQLKSHNFIIFEEQRQSQPDILTVDLEHSNQAENRPQNFLQNDEIFQINSLVLDKQAIKIQRTTPDLNDIAGSTQRNRVAIEKCKVEKQLKKIKKVFTLEEVSKSYSNFIQNEYKGPEQHSFFNYARRRITLFDQENIKKIDLGVCNTREIVEYCASKKLISVQVYASYTFQKDFIDEENFISKFKNKRTEKLQIAKMYFTPFDHRLLCKILCQQFPNEFKFPSNLLQQSHNLTKFYSYLYSISDEQYGELCQNLNTKYNRSWMPESFIGFNQVRSQKIKNLSNLKQEQSFPFHMAPRKLRKKF